LAAGVLVALTCLTAAVTGDAAASAGGGDGSTLYTVQAGDTLYRIALRSGASTGELIARNGLTPDGAIRSGQVLLLPPTPGAGTYTAQANLTYVVRAGDTLHGIARRFSTTAAALSAANGLTDPNRLAVGQVVNIPVAPAGAPLSGPNLSVPLQALPALERGDLGPASASYAVVAGDTLYGIARRFGVSVDALMAANGLRDANTLRLGQILRIPAGGGTPPPPTPSPGAPPSSTVLPVALFGSTATDPNRIALIGVFDRWADAYQVPRDLLKGVAFVESGWRADARSSSGAIGIGQLLPSTAAWVAASMLGDPSLDPTRAEDNIRMTARYLRYLLDQTGDQQVAVGSYYQGLGSVQREGLRPVTQQYIARVATARAAFG
jgi:N-acetylmuramoyl-L-alanine amidase